MYFEIMLRIEIRIEYKGCWLALIWVFGREYAFTMSNQIITRQFNMRNATTFCSKIFKWIN